MGNDKITPDDYKIIEESAKKNCKESQRFERIVLDK